MGQSQSREKQQQQQQQTTISNTPYTTPTTQNESTTTSPINTSNPTTTFNTSELNLKPTLAVPLQSVKNELFSTSVLLDPICGTPLSIPKQYLSMSSSPGFGQQSYEASSPKEQEKRTTLIYWQGGGKNIQISGTFNDWQTPIPLKKEKNYESSVVLQLSPGLHMFKFLIDGEWKCSHDYETALDEKGNLVNVVQVDLTEQNILAILDKKPVDSDSESLYHQEIPEYLLSSSANATTGDLYLRSIHQPAETKPPLLPSLLEKAILNAQMPSELSGKQSDGVVTPHVVNLNHLYALSIKHQVMGLSVSFRYRKKYLTLIYYKPVDS